MSGKRKGRISGMAEQRYNFRDANFLIVDPDRAGARLISCILSGFGISDPYVLKEPSEAKVLLNTGAVDAAVITLGTEIDRSLDLIRWVRSAGASPLRFMPIIALTGYSQLRHVALARDAGASFVVRKPIAPDVLFERLVWAANSARAFVEASSYCGPDRRFRRQKPPKGNGQRAADHSLGIGEQADRNPLQAQDEVPFPDHEIVEI